MGAQLGFAVAVTFPVLLGFLIGVIRWPHATRAFVAVAVAVAVTIAASRSSTWRYVAPVASGFWLLGIALGALTRRLARRIAS